MRREQAELIERTPADGLIAGTATVNGEPLRRRRRLRRSLLRLHGPRRHPGRAGPPQEGPPVRADRAYAATRHLLRRGRRRPPGRHRLPGRLRSRHARLRTLGPARRPRSADLDRRRPLLRRQRGDRRLRRSDRRHRELLARHGRPGDDRGRRPRRLRARGGGPDRRPSRQTGSSTSASPTRPRRSASPSGCSPTSRGRCPNGRRRTRSCCATSSPSAGAAPMTSTLRSTGSPTRDRSPICARSSPGRWSPP